MIRVQITRSPFKPNRCPQAMRSGHLFIDFCSDLHPADPSVPSQFSVVVMVSVTCTYTCCVHVSLSFKLPDKHGITPLLAAIYEGHSECVKLLLEKVFCFCERRHSTVLACEPPSLSLFFLLPSLLPC